MSQDLPLDIRPVQDNQLLLLRDLAEETFLTAFAPHNTAADMASYTQAYLSLEYITGLQQTTGADFFLAWLGEQAVGYLQLNTGTAQNEQLLENAIEVERIYVHEDYQGRRLGLKLLDFAIGCAHQLHKDWIWLGVWDQNQGAIRFYERHGFSTFSQHDFMLGQDRQTDWLMKRKL